MITTPPLPPRQLVCARCGTAFACQLGGGCWCDDETLRLPLPTVAGEDCLCPTCLRKAAQAHQEQQQQQ